MQWESLIGFIKQQPDRYLHDFIFQNISNLPIPTGRELFGSPSSLSVHLAILQDGNRQQQKPCDILHAIPGGAVDQEFNQAKGIEIERSEIDLPDHPMNRRQKRGLQFSNVKQRQKAMGNLYDSLVLLAMQYGDNAIIDNLVEFIPYVRKEMPIISGIVKAHEKLIGLHTEIMKEYQEALKCRIS